MLLINDGRVITGKRSAVIGRENAIDENATLVCAIARRNSPDVVEMTGDATVLSGEMLLTDSSKSLSAVSMAAVITNAFDEGTGDNTTPVSATNSISGSISMAALCTDTVRVAPLFSSPSKFKCWPNDSNEVVGAVGCSGWEKGDGEQSGCDVITTEGSGDAPEAALVTTAL